MSDFIWHIGTNTSANTGVTERRHGLPGVKCRRCSNWKSLAVAPIACPDELDQSLRSGQLPISPREQKTLIKRINRNRLLVEAGIRMEPSMDFAGCDWTLPSNDDGLNAMDIFWPIGMSCIVSRRFKVEAGALLNASFHPVWVRGTVSNRWFELLPHNSTVDAYRIEFGNEMSVCEECGRIDFHEPTQKMIETRKLAASKKIPASFVLEDSIFMSHIHGYMFSREIVRRLVSKNCNFDGCSLRKIEITDD